MVTIHLLVATNKLQNKIPRGFDDETNTRHRSFEIKDTQAR